MKKFSSYLFFLIVTIAAVSCVQSGFKRTKSGLLYKVISDSKNPLVKRGEFLKLNFLQKIGDSVLSSSYGYVPAYAKVDSIGPVYNPAEIFQFLRKGDSAVVVELADTLQRKYGQLPPFIKKKDKITVTFKVLDVFANQDLVGKDRDSEIKNEHDREDKAISAYLASNKINAQKTALGTYVQVNSVGDGTQVDTGKQVGIMYTGKSFPDGKVFESNITGMHKDTLKFVVGKRGMIAGMDDGVRLFKKGGSGTLYLPAYLAYDAQQGPNHKSYENLIFDIKVVDVTDAPKEQPRPAGANRINPELLKKMQEQSKKAK